MRALLFETVTGHPVRDLQVARWEYDTGILAADSLKVTVPAYTAWARTLDLRALLAKDKYSIALIDESVEGVKIVPAAGVIVQSIPKDDPDGKPAYEVTCRGIERLMEGRKIRLFPGWPLLDAQNKPTGVYDQAFENVEYGTIMKRLVSESEKFPGGALPIVYEADRPGIHERTAYKAIDGKPVIEAMDQLADLEDGVEYDFQPTIDDLDRVTYRLVTGRDASRVITGPVERVWNLGGACPDVRRYERVPSSAPTVTDAVFSGGKESDKVLLARSEDHSLLAGGVPRSELWDSSHSSVSVQATLQSWADGALGEKPDRVSFQVRSHLAYGVRHGDSGELAVQGHWDMPDGVYPVRVLSVGRDSSDPDWVSISLV